MLRRGKRKRAAEEKNIKLKSPNFCVSPVRLSVRNIPHSWTEKQLKQVFLDAVKQRASKENPTIKQVGAASVQQRLWIDTCWSFSFDPLEEGSRHCKMVFLCVCHDQLLSMCLHMINWHWAHKVLVDELLSYSDLVCTTSLVKPVLCI